jgi:hypothetical protein
LVWTKRRSNIEDNAVFDSVRGVQNQITTNKTNAESTKTNALSSFDSNGFTTGANNALNTDDETYVAWCWRAAGAANTFNVLEGGTVTSDSTASGAGITAGTITTGWGVSANRDAGFSIVKWSSNGTVGATIGHGLSSPPEMFILKDTSNPRNWLVYHSAIGATGGAYLNLDDRADTGLSQFWNNTSPTDSVFSVSNFSNESGNNNMITYLFHSVDDYQRIGTYSGTGLNGNRTYTTDDGTPSGTGGFEPRWLLVKRTDVADNWVIVDSVRGLDDSLFPDDSSQELSNAGAVSFNSDGFTVNGASGGWNNGSGTYIYLAIA